MRLRCTILCMLSVQPTLASAYFVPGAGARLSLSRGRHPGPRQRSLVTLAAKPDGASSDGGRRRRPKTAPTARNAPPRRAKNAVEATKAGDTNRIEDTSSSGRPVGEEKRGSRSSRPTPSSPSFTGWSPTRTPEDMHVLVPVNDVISVPLAALSEAAADTVSGAGVDSSIDVRVAMERFCRTLESVCRTDYSARVDRADAAPLLGSRWERGAGVSGSPDSSRKSVNGGLAPPSDQVTPGFDGTAMQLQAVANGSARGRVGKRRMAPWKQRNQQGGETDTGSLSGVDGEKQKGRWSRRNGGRRARNAEERAREAEERCLPLLHLVEDLVRDAMFSPISERDVMMSQALSAEFPTYARVRPVFGNMASVFDWLHERPEATAGPAQQSVVPFEGKLLMFKRGNGVEETKGRLVLKKLDFIQSNAVRWLSQSVTDTIKCWQEQSLEFVNSCSRDISRRKDDALRDFVERAVDFGLERETLARFLPATDATELAATQMLDDAPKQNARRAAVSLRRYGTRDVKIELEAFCEDGAWPPGDDSWFWDTRKLTARHQLSREKEESTMKYREGEAADGKGVRSSVLPRVTLGAVLSRSTQTLGQAEAQADAMENGGKSKKTPKRKSQSPPSALSRLLSKCAIKEPTYQEVVVVYYKRQKDRRLRVPRPLAFVWKLLKKIVRLGRKKDGKRREADRDAELSAEHEGPGLGLQLRIYRGVPLVSLNAVTPDKRVEVRPQTALRLDLTTVVGLGLVLANIRFDSPVLVVAATASVVLFIVRTIFGYLNTRIRVESFVSRDILDKTMGSNVPVLRHLAEEAAQQKSRYVALVYAALLRCALDDEERRTGDSAEGDEGGRWVGEERVTSAATVSRQCAAIMKACVGQGWEAEVNLQHWLRELERLKIIIRTETDTRAERTDNDQDCRPRALPLALEQPGAVAARHSATEQSIESAQKQDDPGSESSTKDAGSRSPASNDPLSTNGAHDSSEGAAPFPDSVVFYRLLTPEAAAEQLRNRWAELVEPLPAGVQEVGASWDVNREQASYGQGGGNTRDMAVGADSAVANMDSTNGSDGTSSVYDGAGSSGKGGNTVWRRVGRSIASRAGLGPVGGDGVAGVGERERRDEFTSDEADEGSAGSGVPRVTGEFADDGYDGESGAPSGMRDAGNDPDIVRNADFSGVDDGYDGGGLL